MSSSRTSPSIDELRSRLSGLMVRDAHRMRRRLDGLRKARRQPRTDILTSIATDIDKAEERVRRRRESVPELTYPEELPVSQRRTRSPRRSVTTRW